MEITPTIKEREERQENRIKDLPEFDFCDRSVELEASDRALDNLRNRR